MRFAALFEFQTFCKRSSARASFPLRLSRVRPLAGGRAPRGSQSASRSDLRHPPFDRVAGDTGRSLRCPLADRRHRARLHGETRLLTIRLVQILFPGAALLVMSAWCLGILNSHRKFFLSYSAPVIWNVAMITALLWKGGRVGGSRLAIIISIASVIGSGLQFAVQLPTVHELPSPTAPEAHIRHRASANGGAKLLSRIHQPRRGASKCVCRFVSGQLSAWRAQSLRLPTRRP